MNKVIIYTRVATKEQAHVKVSLAKQVADCVKYAKDNNMNIFAIHQQKLSAKQAAEDVELILNDMVDRNVRTLLISDWSRISRDAVTLLEIKDRFKSYDKSIISLIGEVSLPIHLKTILSR